MINNSRQPGDTAMMHQIKTAASRSRDTLLQDAVGVGALIVMLVVGLHLSALA